MLFRSGFRDDVYDQLSGSDKKLLDLFFLKYDNSNLLTYLKDKDAELDSRGNLSAEELEVLVRALKDGDTPPAMSVKIPYFSKFIASYLSEQNIGETALWDDQLAALYYAYAMKADNKFVADWYEFNLNLNNILIGMSAKKYHFDATNYIVGDNEVAEAIRTSSARDWGLTGVVDYLDQIQRVAEESDPLEREKKIDLIKWNWLDEIGRAHV